LKINSHFLLVPLSPGTSKWVLIRIHWGDNWGSYKWSSDATGPRAGSTVRRLGIPADSAAEAADIVKASIGA
jgi:hypothetical protein